MDENAKDPRLSADERRIRVLLSHIPLLPITRKEIKEKITRHSPSFIFSGHNHESLYFGAPKDNPHAQEFQPLRGDGSIWQFESTGDKLHEVTVPTCSYRMGKQSYGYGFAIITGSGDVYYTVLWLPSRFSQLWMYLTCIGVAFLLFLPAILSWISHRISTLCKKCCTHIFRKCPKYHRL